MACRYYDEILAEKIKRWLPTNTPLRVLKPDESKKLFELTADDLNDSPFKLPIIALSRNNDIELLSTIKSPKSYDGLRYYKHIVPDNDMTNYKGEALKEALNSIPKGVYEFNVIPIRLVYQLDIFTKTYEEADEYIRNFLFKLINNPLLKIVIPYQDLEIAHTANIRVLDRVSDTSAISERVFSGQFQRWTIQLEIQDAFLFSIPFRKNWKFYFDDGSSTDASALELTHDINTVEETEPLDTSLNTKLN